MTPYPADRVGGEKPVEGHPVEAGQARMQMSIHVKVVGLLLVLARARSNPHALTGMTWVNNLQGCGRNTGRPD
jgi:hypothetical protein